jgi:hypothetical protein
MLARSVCCVRAFDWSLSRVDAGLDLHDVDLSGSLWIFRVIWVGQQNVWFQLPELGGVDILRHAWRSRQQPLWHVVALSPLYPVCFRRALSCPCETMQPPCCPSECTSASVATEHCAVMCTSSPFSCLGSPRQCVSLHPHVGRAGICCLCAGHHAPSWLHTRPYEKPVADRRPHVAPACVRKALLSFHQRPCPAGCSGGSRWCWYWTRRWWTVCMCWRIASVVLRSALVRPPSVCVAVAPGAAGAV